METDEKMWPRETRILMADNGFVIVIGCQKYVHEGTAESLTEDLRKYLSRDHGILTMYGYVGDSAFVSGHGELALEEKCPQACYLSPAFGHAQNNLTPVTATYKLNNGTLTLDYEKGTAKVFQTRFPVRM